MSSEEFMRKREEIQSTRLTVRQLLPCRLSQAFRLGAGMQVASMAGGWGRGPSGLDVGLRPGLTLSRQHPPASCLTVPRTPSAAARRGEGGERRLCKLYFLLTASVPPLCSYLCPHPAAPSHTCEGKAGRKEERE